MKNLILTILGSLTLNCFAELPVNQTQALREQIYSRINAPSPGTMETIGLLDILLKSVEKRMSEILPAIKGEIARSTSELNLFVQKNRNGFNPVRNDEFRKRAQELSKEACCSEIALKRKPKGG